MNIRTNYNMICRSLLTRISPKLCVRILFRYYFKRPLHLDNPQTLDEKIQWMKLYYYKNNLLIKRCADKYTVREYIKECGLEHLLNTLYGCYNSADEIKWDELPNKFVLKWNFGCGGNVICSDKTLLNIKQVTKELNRFGRIKYHLLAAEPQYNPDKKRIVCERFIETENGDLPEDYKLYCFNGEAKFVLCCLGRGKNEHPNFYFFDRQWNLLRLNRQGKEAPEGFVIPKPKGVDQLFEYAERLSKPFPFVRVDFYLEKGKAIFGELTFTPGGGFDTGRLPESDKYFGSLVKLPQLQK